MYSASVYAETPLVHDVHDDLAMSPRRVRRRRSAALSQHPAVWVSARARNALRRPAFITAVSMITFITSLVALIIVPQQARRAANAVRPPAALRPDTEPTVSALMEADRQVAAAETALVASRAAYAQVVAAAATAAAADTTANGAPLANSTRVRRDTLTAQVDLLAKLIARAENAPLLNSYRILAQAAPMQGDPQVKLKLDSLVEIERERDSYTAVGGVDPVFVALTARANELGRNIAALAEAKRVALQREAIALAPPALALPTAVAAMPLPDTVAAIKVLEDARVAARGVASRFAHEKNELTQLDAREERARELSSVGASPTAILAAALVFGAVLGFGAAFFAEVRHPRVADLDEVERVTGVKVLGVVRPLAPTPERRRRAADRTSPAYMDSGGDGHQLVYLNVAAAGTSTVMLTVTGDVPGVAAIIAINFAAIAADEARATLLLDTDPSTSIVSTALRMRPRDGMSAIARGAAEWSDMMRGVRLGRDRVIDVVPSGSGAVSTEQVAAVLGRDAARLSRRYDALVLVSGLDQVTDGLVAGLPISDVLLCARAGQTKLADLAHTLDAIREKGGNPRGIVIWNAPDPAFAQARPVEEVEREGERALAV